MNYWLIFLTGLTTGGLSCLAVQGGLLAATLANTTEDKSIAHGVLPTVMFLASKLIAYTLLGGLLGYFGTVFQITPQIQIAFQIGAAILMLGLVGNMLNLHPVFRYFVPQPPHWVGRFLKDQTKSRNFFAPSVLGLFTVLIPCPVTLAMEVLAVSSASPVVGALIMASFILGTSPLFLVIGWITTKLSQTFRDAFFKLAAVLVAIIALTALNGALVLSGSKFTFDNLKWAFTETFLTQAAEPKLSQNVTINVSGSGYSPRYFSVKVGQPVTLDLVTRGGFSCANVFTIPALGISKNLPQNGKTTVAFTPTQAGPLNFSCGMGMFTGTINVVM